MIRYHPVLTATGYEADQWLIERALSASPEAFVGYLVQLLGQRTEAKSYGQIGEKPGTRIEIAKLGARSFAIVSNPDLRHFGVFEMKTAKLNAVAP